MGFVTKSNNKKIYAYLTENGKTKIITGDTIDFQVKYFSLHDNDVNYYISSKKANNIYNTLPSGFIPDITGDDNLCAPNTLNTVLKDMLITPETPVTPITPITVAPLSGTIIEGCSSFNSGGETNMTIRVINPSGGTGSPYKCRIEPIDSNGDSVIIDGTFLTPFEIDEVIDFLPSEEDDSSIFYKVYLIDSLGNEGFIGTTSITCKPRRFLIKFETTQTSFSSPGTTLYAYTSTSPNKWSIAINPPSFFYLDVTLRTEDDTPITEQERELVEFSIFPLYTYSDDIRCVNEESSANFIESVNTTANDTNTIITKTLAFKASRNSVAGPSPIGPTNISYEVQVQLNVTPYRPYTNLITIQNSPAIAYGSYLYFN
jgi:hypothetical protein